MFLPTALAWLVIPHTWSWMFFDGDFIYNSWRLYLSFCGLPMLIGAMCLSFFPESPKFLMSQGRNQEALQVFRKMYSMNMGHPPESYPVEKNFLSSTTELPNSGELALELFQFYMLLSSLDTRAGVRAAGFSKFQ